jgi:hypothetical protein
LHSEKQERRFLLLQCRTPPKSLCSTLFAAIYKRPEGGLETSLALVWRAFWAWVFEGFGLILSLWAFWCGKLLEGERITEGERIPKGKLLKGKIWLKRD